MWLVRVKLGYVKCDGVKWGVEYRTHTVGRITIFILISYAKKCHQNSVTKLWWYKDCDSLSRGSTRTVTVSHKDSFSQSSVLASLTHKVNIIDMPDRSKSFADLFVDESNPMKPQSYIEYHKELQKDLDNLHTWGKLWKMSSLKGHTLKMNKCEGAPRGEHSIGGKAIKKARNVEDMGVIGQSNLSPREVY